MISARGLVFIGLLILTDMKKTAEHFKANQDAFESFLKRFHAMYHGSVDADAAEIFIQRGNRYLADLKSPEGQPYEGILKQWKDSGDTDYTIYASEEYAFEGWASWAWYSRNICTNLDRAFEKGDKLRLPFDRTDVRSILDIGCGIGYSTVALSKVFPTAKVYGSQLSGTLQYDYCSEHFEGHENITLVDEKERWGHVDAIFASEFFEHLKEPVALMEELDESFTPKILIVKSTFGAPNSPGHFDEYILDGKTVAGCTVARLFNQRLKDLGYIRPEKSFFNAWPLIFIHRERFEV